MDINYNAIVLLFALISFTGLTCNTSNTEDNRILALTCLGNSELEEFVTINIDQTHIFSDGSLFKERAAKYSEMGIRAEIEGQTIVGFDLDKYGRKSNIYIYAGIGAGLDEASFLAVKEQYFIPALQNQKRVCTRSFVVLNFD